MPIWPAAARSGEDSTVLAGDADLLPRHPIFRAGDLDLAREYLSGVLAPHRLTYLTPERRLNFRHRRARLGLVELNALEFGGDVMVTASHFPDYFLLQFTLAGSCTLTQGGGPMIWARVPSPSSILAGPLGRAGHPMAASSS
jgi:AraC-binding-like domain